MKKIRVNEIFYSLQGEGVNQGAAATFIRLAGCNLKCSFCDTEFDTYIEMTASEILEQIKSHSSKLIIWTGGEPTLQLNDELLMPFEHYQNAIETNGTNPVPSRINYISCSPKVSPKKLHKNFTYVDEFRYAIQAGDPIPHPSELPNCGTLLLSPIFNPDDSLNLANTNYCIEYIKANPAWKLSIQIHKLLGIE